MKKTISMLLLICSVQAYAFPENLRRDTVLEGMYNSQKQCPLNYCKNNDEGFSMRNWCAQNGGEWGHWPVVIGWAKLNGFECFCGCNNLW